MAIPSALQLPLVLFFSATLVSAGSTASDCTSDVDHLLQCWDRSPWFFDSPTCCSAPEFSHLPNGSYCVDLNEDPDFCGACNIRCSRYELCCQGACTNVYQDVSNCGLCGYSCPAGYQCRPLHYNPTDDTFSPGSVIDDAGFPDCVSPEGIPQLDDPRA